MMATAGMGAKRRYTMHISETSCLCAAGRSARRPSGRGGATRAAPRTSARTARGQQRRQRGGRGCDRGWRPFFQQEEDPFADPFFQA